jgi:hypothetical protein
VGQCLEEESALADSRLASEKCHGTGNEAAPENPIQFVHSCGDGSGVLDIDISDAAGGGCGNECESCSERGTVAHRFLDILDEAVPGATRGAFSGPFGERSPAVGTVVDETQSSHVRTLEVGCCT